MKVCVFGRPGSGKSTFATKLAKRLDIPVFHLDKHFFVDNWVERDYQEFLKIQQEIIAQPHWVIDGNAMRSLELRFQRATIAIYFNYPLSICLWRTLKRSFQKEWTIPDLADGCKKSIRWKLLKYLYQFRARYNPRIEELHQKYPNVSLHVFKSDRDINLFLSEIASETDRSID